MSPAPFSFGLPGESIGFSWHPGGRFALSQPAPLSAQSGLVFAFGLVRMKAHSHTVGISFARSQPNPLGSSSGPQFLGVPNPPLKSDPACIAFRSLSTFRYPGFVHRLGAGVAA